jgi:hypothetical protein
MADYATEFSIRRFWIISGAIMAIIVGAPGQERHDDAR